MEHITSKFAKANRVLKSYGDSMTALQDSLSQYHQMLQQAIKETTPKTAKGGQKR